MLRYFLPVLLLVSTPLRADDLDSGIAKIASDLSAAVSKSASKKISVINFTDLDGHDSQLGRFMAEQLSVSLVNSAKDFVVMDRANMESILKEHKLTASGLVNPDNARKLGQFAGVDAIILGTITPFGQSLIVTAKAISTETTQVLGATKISITRSRDIDAMLGLAASSSPSEASPTEVPSPPVAPKPVYRAKDFSAPNAAAIFPSMAFEVVSFKLSGPNSVLVLVRVQNRSPYHPIKIGLNHNNRGAIGTFLIDGRGNTNALTDANGLSFTRNFYGNDQDTFQSLRRMAAAYAHDRNRYGIQNVFFSDLNQMTDVAVGQSVQFTLQFSRQQALALDNIFTLNASVIAVEIHGNERAEVYLNNVVIPGIQPLE